VYFSYISNSFTFKLLKYCFLIKNCYDYDKMLFEKQILIKNCYDYDKMLFEKQILIKNYYVMIMIKCE